MNVIQGEGISGGAALGTLHLFRRTAAVLPSKGAGPEREKARFAQARRRAADELESLAERCRGTYGDDAADLFAAYAMLTEDEDFAAHVLSALEEKGCSAERAVQQAGERLAAMLSATDDPALQARADDVRDVTRRILNQLLGAEAAGPALCAPVILAADDLSPSELLRMDRGSLLGFLTRDGSANSHTAILARTMGIPAVCGLGDGLNQVREGQRVCLDGTGGTVYLEPDEATLRLFQEERARQQERKTQPEFPDVPPDEPPEGRRIRLCCNIGAPSEVEAVRSSGGQG
ncbi:MAG: phosphoenolpyruvate--protein phosphotransferase, partial [Clostridiales bacterium]|nr:phosphoenolpyruvate--protein phosphotransferase [Clostridiales bacterium]